MEKETQFKNNKIKNDQKEVAREVKLEKAAAERKLAREMELDRDERYKAHVDVCFPSVAPSAAPPAATVQARAALASKMPSGYVAAQARAALASKHDESMQLAMNRCKDKRRMAADNNATSVRKLVLKRELDTHEAATNDLYRAQREALATSASKRQKTEPPPPPSAPSANVWRLLDNPSSSSSSSSLFTVVKPCDNYVAARTHKAWNSSTKKGNAIWRSARQ